MKAFAKTMEQCISDYQCIPNLEIYGHVVYPTYKVGHLNGEHDDIPLDLGHFLADWADVPTNPGVCVFASDVEDVRVAAKLHQIRNLTPDTPGMIRSKFSELDSLMLKMMVTTIGNHRKMEV